MALVVKDRVRETSTSTGTGAITLNGAVAGFQGFSVIGDGNTTYYTIVDAATGAWEVGIGTYTLVGSSLSRDTVLESSNNGNKVDFAVGTKDVFCTYPAERSVYVENGVITPAVSATIPNTSVSGLGTLSTQDANNVAITGGAISGASITTSTADINGGSIDGVTLGTNSPVTNAQIDNININGNTVSSTDTNGNIILDPNGTGYVQEDVGGVKYNLVSRRDIGTAPNQIPLNQYLGSMAYEDNDSVNITGGTLSNVSLSASLPSVISVNSSSDALRITQTGAGNALVVEDSTNPDASPFVVDSVGRVTVGNVVAISSGVIAVAPYVQLQGLDNNTTSIGATNWSSNANITPSFNFNRSFSNTVGARGALTTNGTTLGMISFTGDDGTNWVESARISSFIDGTPGTNDMPGRLVFSTTADGSSSPTERMRIDSAGNVRVGTAALATTATNGFLYIPTCAGTPTGTPTTVTGLAPMVIDSTNNKLYIYSGGAWVALN